MAVFEELRHKVRGYFTELMDEERAAQVMEAFSPVGWADLATKQDIEGLRKQDIQDLHKDIEGLHKDIEGLHKDIEGLRELTTVRFEAIEQRMATKQDIAELRAHMDETLRKHTFALVAFVVSFVLPLAGVLVAAAHLA